MFRLASPRERERGKFIIGAACDHKCHHEPVTVLHPALSRASGFFSFTILLRDPPCRHLGHDRDMNDCGNPNADEMMEPIDLPRLLSRHDYKDRSRQEQQDGRDYSGFSRVPQGSSVSDTSVSSH